MGWYKSSYSGGDQGDCLEVARHNAAVPVRDSKAAGGPTVLFSACSWSAFVTALKDGNLPSQQRS
ncbi:DUF397 domain-containing protein [Streptomyces sp. NPDC049687]|uniref:DUF397 domain-containing protein n=1 Tax=Streptomyces sp. NPDC049687 TaxID=3365596 RepID=UPI003794FFC9